MLRKTALRLAALFLVAPAFPVCYLAAQETQDAPSVAEAARRAREKKEAASKPATVLTNDTMPANSAPDANAPAAANAPSATAPSGSTASSEGQSGASPDTPETRKEIEALEKEIADKQASVDLLRRELGLEQDNYYSKQDYQRDTAGKQKLDALQSDLKAAQDELAALKAKLTDLAGADALKAPANPPAQSQP